MSLAGSFVVKYRLHGATPNAFVTQFEKVGKIASGFIRVTPLSKPVTGMGAIIDTSPPGTVVWVVYLPQDVPGLPAMQCQVHLRQGGSFLGDSFVESSPRVLCDLDRPAADWVLAHGLPKELIEGMAGNASQSVGTTADITIDPKQYLPPEAWEPH